MRKQPAIETNPTGIASVLSVSPMEEDHFSLQSIFNHSKWRMRKVYSLTSALAILKTHKTPVVLCESELSPGTWRDLLKQVTRLPFAPTFILSSRLADDRLWAEALNLGAWDVLAKPFDRGEVFRAVSVAWGHWKNSNELPAAAMNAMRAAG